MGLLIFNEYVKLLSFDDRGRNGTQKPDIYVNILLPR
jgi:hypothetical protein